MGALYINGTHPAFSSFIYTVWIMLSYLERFLLTINSVGADTSISSPAKSVPALSV